MNPSRSRALGECAGVLATGGAFLVIDDILHRKAVFVIPCLLIWSIYIAIRLRRDRSLHERWGIRADNLGSASVAPLLFATVATILLAAYRLARGWQGLPPEAFALFGLYILWGFVQQFIVQALLVKNLESLGVVRRALVPIAGILFGLVHVPEWRLAGLCAVAGAFWALFFLRKPNLIPLAVAHAWLGILVYFWVLERNPWREFTSGLPSGVPR